MKELVAIGDDAAALDERFAWRAQQLAAYTSRCRERAGGAADSDVLLDNLAKGHRALASSNLGRTYRGPSGDERAPNNLYANYNGERRKAGHQEFVNLLTACSNFRPRARGGS